MADSKKNVFFIGGYSYAVDKSTPLCRHEDFFRSATLYQSQNGRFFVVENDAADTTTVKVLSKSDENHLEQSLCTVQDFKSGGFPSCPCVHRLGHARALLGLVDALGVDGFGLCAVPCSVQALGKSGLAFPVQLPCLVHNFRKIVLHMMTSLYIAGQLLYNGPDPVVGFSSVS